MKYLSRTAFFTTALSLLAIPIHAEESQDYTWSSPANQEGEIENDRMSWNLGIRRSDRLTAEVSADAAHDKNELAKQLANPIASLISVPMQNNFDWGSGPDGDGFQWKLNVQPVIPLTLNEDWNLITRTIIPIISQKDTAGTSANPSGRQSGLGDILVSLWASPKEATKSGWIWGVGPAINMKTASDALLGTGQWGLGPTAIVLKQNGPWTYGALANHLWSVGGDDDRADLNNTFIQPFLTYNTPNAVSIALNTESLYNWGAEQWTVPINLMVSKLVTFGKQPVQFQIGGRYYAEAPESGPEWGLRAAVTLLFPK